MIRRREWIACASLSSGALLVHVICTSWLGARDPIAMTTSHHLVAMGLAVLTLVGARICLLVLPGWWLWMLARVVSDRISSRPRTGA